MPTARYQLRLKDQAGNLQAVFDQWSRLTYVKQVNRPGYFSLWMHGDDDRLSLFTLDSQLEVWRSIPDLNIDWYKDFEGFFRSPVHQRTATGSVMFTAYGRGYLDLLQRRHILYYSGSDQAGKSGPGETVIKEYVDENAGPSATIPPRLLESGITSGLTIQTDNANGANWNGSRAYKNLLGVCQEICEETGLDMEIVGTGPGTFEFRIHDGQLGSDRSTQGLNVATGVNAAGNAPTIFSTQRQNMLIPIYSVSRNDEINALAVLGQGEANLRQLALVTNDDASDSPWNLHEGTRLGISQDSVAGLTSFGEGALKKLEQQESFTFNVSQVEGTVYGRDYFLGDTVTVHFETDAVDITRHEKIVQLTISIAAEADVTENIEVEMSQVLQI